MIKTIVSVGTLLCAMASFPMYASGGVRPFENLTLAPQQQEKCMGVVRDATGEPIMGATIVVKGTRLTTSTGVDGTFSLTGVKKGATVHISFIGFEPQDLKWNGQTLEVELKSNDNSLNEAIVVGYTTQRKESLTGALNSVKADDLKGTTTPSVENMLNGKVAGVFVAPGSGQPGSEGAVIIRGQASINGNSNPLWVIDGVIVGDRAYDLNPSDIESMTILKDAASTAIYGSQGANGVVVVTTKRGKVEKFHINASAKFGASVLNRGNMQMMNGAELYDYFKSFSNQEKINFERYTPELRNDNFDWYDLAKQTGFTQDYNITMSGGTEMLQSLLSLNYYKETGAVKGYDYQRYNFRFKSTYKPYSWLSIRPSVSASMKDIDDKQYDVTSMFQRLPWDSPYDKDGNIVPPHYSGWVNTIPGNYLYDLEMGNKSDSRDYEAMVSLDFDVRFTDWLTFSSVNNYRWMGGSSNSYTDPRSESGEGVGGRIYGYSANTVRRYTNQKLMFNKSWGVHAVNGLLAYEFNDYHVRSLSATGTGFISGFEVLNVVSKPEAVGGGISEWAVKSWFLNANYAYDNRYLAQVMVRRDGASNFGTDNKYGNFFSVSAGWNINREKWFKAEWVDNLKLRAAYGTVGNRPTSLYPQYDLYSVSSKYNGEPGLLISQIGNKELTWEKTYTLGVGFDASFFQSRLRVTFDWYDKRTDNILFQVPITGLTGVTSIWKNVGKMKNQGVELTVGGDLIRTRDLTWSLDLNLGHNKNELTDIYKQKDANGNMVAKPVIKNDYIAGGSSTILEIGTPVDTYYMREWAGVDPETGAAMWYMTDKDGNKVTTTKYDEADEYKCGTSSPTLFGGFNTQLTYKGFDFAAVFGYSLGGHIYNYTRTEYDSDGAYTDRNQMKLKDGWSRWTKPGDIATHPKAEYGNTSNSNKVSSRYIESNDYLKLRSITLGYNFSLPQYGVSNVRVYFSGENLLTFTGYSGVDPELPYDSSNGIVHSAAPSVYPAVRKFMFGLNLSF